MGEHDSKFRYSITRHFYTRGLIVDKTASQRQQKYREQIAKGKKKRLQVVIDWDEAERLNDICSSEGISKTDFVRRAIESWSGV
jgi:outer membrane receptor for Fe3+-dicitrate